MYSKLPNLVLGFHGCSSATMENVLYNHKQLKSSENTYDWLGHGIYFWEQNFSRAYAWAKNRYGKDAAVIGAVLDLGHCLNLTDSISEEYLRLGFEILKSRCDAAGTPIPQNRQSEKTTDVLLRDLDCAVIQQIHDCVHVDENDNDFDSVRGVFVEGESPYPGSEFKAKTHIQICIRNLNCIKGYFFPMVKDPGFPMP